MRPQELESFAFDCAERVVGGQPVEDNRVELKREWPIDPASAARRIAGHSNAARADEVVWIIGIDEKKGEVVGADAIEVGEWWDPVREEFDGPEPVIECVSAVRFENVTLYAVCFSTGDFPYVVKHPGRRVDGVPFSDRLEVPWRAGTRTRSARHEELVAMLEPLAKAPRLRALDAQLRARLNRDAHGEFRSVRWRFGMEAYMTPQSYGTVIARDRCRVFVELPRTGARFLLERATFRVPDVGEEFIGRSFEALPHLKITDFELIATGPTRLGLVAVSERPVFQGDPIGDAHVEITLAPELTEAVRLELPLVPRGKEVNNESHEWGWVLRVSRERFDWVRTMGSGRSSVVYGDDFPLLP